MSTVDPHLAHSFARRVPPRRIIIAHGDKIRTFTVRPWLVGTLAAITTVFSVLYLGATGYLVFRDDILAASIARQARMQNAYEDRVATLRADIDRLTSRQLLNQEEVEARMEKLLGRQAALDTRQDIIAGLSQAARRAGLTPSVSGEASPVAVESERARAKTPFKTSSVLPTAAPRQAPAANLSTPLAEMDEVTISLDELARDQVSYVDAVATRVATRSSQIAAALKQIGHSVPAPRAAEDDGVGGPFVSLEADADPETFRASVALVNGQIERFSIIRRFANQLPLARPLPGAAVTSRYGSRLDPFLGKPALHSGVDFRASEGTPVPATAGGTVISAGNFGSYGNMVEIDHGHGVTTRYAHMSRIMVKVGQVVNQGTIVGKAGSTGRSTGPHLHYEVRVDGAATNPMTYFAAGKEILPLL